MQSTTGYTGRGVRVAASMLLMCKDDDNSKHLKEATMDQTYFFIAKEEIFSEQTS